MRFPVCASQSGSAQRRKAGTKSTAPSFAATATRTCPKAFSWSKARRLSTNGSLQKQAPQPVSSKAVRGSPEAAHLRFAEKPHQAVSVFEHFSLAPRLRHAQHVPFRVSQYEQSSRLQQQR